MAIIGNNVVLVIPIPATFTVVFPISHLPPIRV